MGACGRAGGRDEMRVSVHCALPLPPLPSGARVGLGHLRLSGMEQGLSSGPRWLTDFGGPGRERGLGPLWPVGGLFIGVAEAGCLMCFHRTLRVGPRLLGGGWRQAGVSPEHLWGPSSAGAEIWG